MKQKTLTVSFAPSSTSKVFPIYVVNPNSSGAKVEGIQIANSSNSATHTCNIVRLEYSKKWASDINYFGDGSVRSLTWNYTGSASSRILSEVKIPPNTSLNTLEIPIYLKPSDVIALTPVSVGSDTKFHPTVTIIEFYEDDADASTTVDIYSVFSSLLAGEY